MKNSKQQGFGVVEAILIIVIIGIIGGAGWYVWSSQQKHYDNIDGTTAPTSTQPTPTTTPSDTYTDSVANFSVKYPTTWKLVTTKATQADLPTVSTTITSPTGTKLLLKTDYGGKGGYCEPKPQDKPYQAGNTCPTAENFSKTAIGETTYGSSYQKGQKIPIYLVESRYESKYMIGLTVEEKYTDTLTGTIKLNSPEMGVYMLEEFFSVYNKNGESQYYVYAYAVGDSEAFLNSSDANTIKTILKSFKFN
ncbi:MAG: hypothetical protein M0R39_17715 [Prolixibacteraceae bacterium]|nr:hypothetical protein [Prolixibacteraceae bacterium]